MLLIISLIWTDVTGSRSGGPSGAVPLSTVPQYNPPVYRPCVPPVQSWSGPSCVGGSGCEHCALVLQEPQEPHLVHRRCAPQQRLPRGADPPQQQPRRGGRANRPAATLRLGDVRAGEGERRGPEGRPGLPAKG